MTKGMTGFGRAVESDGRYEVTVEISSVNKRHLDVTIRLPKGYQQAELGIRQTIAAHLHRGQVTVSASIRTLVAPPMTSTVDGAKLTAQLASLQAMAEAVGAPVPLERAVFELWRQRLEESEGLAIPEVVDLIGKATEKAAADLDRRREIEGEMLAKDIQKRLALLGDLKRQIAEKSVGVVDRIRQRLTDLVARYVPTLASDDRLLREVVLYADKADVSEELSRIDHHLEQAKAAFVTEGAKGKLLEFVLQELLREFNTLGSKTDDAQVSTAVVIAKTELEKMREQVQNVE